jgi:hypothetical protein
MGTVGVSSIPDLALVFQQRKTTFHLKNNHVRRLIASAYHFGVEVKAWCTFRSARGERDLSSRVQFGCIAATVASAVPQLGASMESPW